MPIYEYQCSHCNFLYEEIQKFSDPVKKKCPSCEKMTLKKIISAVAFRLKGGGWYETDFKTGKKSNVVDTASNTEGGGSESGKADGKETSKETDKKADKNTSKAGAEKSASADKSKQPASQPKAGSAS